MAIDIKCPHCQKPYKLKDEMAGKRVQCANQACRKPFAVEPSANGTAHKPAPTPPPPKPAAPPRPPAVDADELAAAALAAEERAANPTLSVIHMTCTMCEHKWDVGLEMQGKNVLCPDCKHRQKVPIPKDATKQDWRVREGPQGRKIDRLEGVQATTDASTVSGGTLLATGVVKIEYEPRPISFYVKIAAGVLVPAVLLAGFLVYRSGRKREEVVAAQFEKIIQESAEELKPLPVYRGVLRAAAARYEAVLNQPAGGKKEVPSRDKAVADIQQGTADLKEVGKGYDRDFLFGELAAAAVLLGGDGEDVKDKKKLSWLPPAAGGTAGNKNAIRPSAAEQGGVQGLLQKVFQAMQEKNGDFEARVMVARRVARELIPVAPPELIDSFARDGFTEQERYEAEGQVGLECLRAGKPDLAKQIAARLAASFTPTQASPPAVSMVALQLATDVKPPAGYLQSATPGVDQRLVQSLTLLAQGKPTEAVTAAKAGTAPAAEKLRALAAVAEGMDQPLPAVTDAVPVAAAAKAEGGNVPVGMSAFRLACAAARSGADPEPFLALVTDDTLRSWAKAEVLRLQLAADKSQMPDVAKLDLPTEARNFRGGHAWAAYQLARHNAAKTGEGKLLKDYAGWPKPFGYFGQAGAAVGLLEKK